MRWKNLVTLVILVLMASGPLSGYLRTQGPDIVDANGEKVLLRGFGLGGWLVPEGYMLHIPGYGSPTSIRNRIVDLIGEEATRQFYSVYRENYVTQRDIDTLASWGMNSIRLPLHYRLLSPSPGEYDESGFALIDNLLEWCEANELYLILDMHCAPGGQNSDNISDSDGEAKLWTHPANQEHLVDLWKTIAGRYVDEQWIGGYDLINEPVLPEGYDNSDLRALYIRIKNAIRSVDENHIIFIEGNWYATDFNRLTPPFDPNMVYAFHKYWNETTAATISQYLNIRNQWGVPLWLGESGENSNVWFHETIQLMEANNIGWNWWTHKKVDTHTSPYSIPRTEGYNSILRYWNGDTGKPPTPVARDALMEFARNFVLDSCRFRPDVLAAITDPEFGAVPKPYSNLTVPGTIPAAEYDIGTQGLTYRDADYMKTRYDVDQPWNKGGELRNDGVDLISTTYRNNRSYAIGYIESGEWTSYTIDIGYQGQYDIVCTVASPDEGGEFQLFLDNQPLTSSTDVPVTGGWEKWEEVRIEAVALPTGRHVLKLRFNTGGYNFLKMQFVARESGPFGGLDSHVLVGQNYPNPFNAETIIPILVSQTTDATLKVYDISGALINTLHSGILSEGLKTVLWNGKDAEGVYVSAGVYYYALEIGEKRKIHDMVLIR